MPTVPPRPRTRRRWTWGMLALFVVVAGGAAALWHREASRGDLVIQSEPGGSRIRVDGVDRGTAPLTLRGLAVGPHRVAAEMDGYQSREVAAEVQGGRSATTQVTLEAKPGELVLEVTPPDGSLVIDGRAASKGMLNGARLVLPCGKHTLEVRREGYLPHSDTVTVSWREPVVLRMALRSALGSLRVESTPAGARVLVEGRPLGVTPLTLPSLKPGARTIRVERAGYHAQEPKVMIEAGRRTTVRVVLHPIPPPVLTPVPVRVPRPAPSSPEGPPGVQF